MIRGAGNPQFESRPQRLSGSPESAHKASGSGSAMLVRIFETGGEGSAPFIGVV